MEIWKDVEGTKNYEVSNLGRIRRKDTGIMCKCGPDKISGYAKCAIYENGRTITKTVHRIVAQAFLEKPDGNVHVHHINEDKMDNRVENLMWVTPKEHGTLRSDESKQRFANTYRKNLEKRKRLHTNAHQPVL